jgi:hypothetical protein
MKNYCALLENNVVTEIIVGDFDWVTENLEGDWVEIGVEPLTIAIGYIYNSDTQEFTPPPPFGPTPKS